MGPLFRVGAQDKYRPFAMGDLQGLVDKLPPIAEGGGNWLGKLEGLTAGYKLALGDFRAITHRCMLATDVRELETGAGTLTLADSVPFTRVSTAIGKHLRDRYPISKAAAIPKFKWDAKQNPRDFLDYCKEKWINQTGCHPGKPGVQQEWYRTAVLKGVPEPVKQAIEENPDMIGADSTKWERHIIFHMTRAQDNQDTEESGLKELQAQLLKIQLAEARQKINEGKKDKDKKGRHVMALTAGPPTPDLFPIPDWIPAPPHTQPQSYAQPPPYRRGPPQWQQNSGRGYGRGGGRPGRGRGGPPRGRTPGACFVCGQMGHWSKECPQRGGHQGGRGYQQRGPYQPLQGPPTGPPQAQFQMTEWNWAGWEPGQQQPQ
ncbi:uncharacterized protein LOC120551550 [Perca fluviatilis]|uniref:uncharacterized protein LOC120551550 n=1 Tax=Perca fluviatilis TaxID=8168 RepID=UPI0019644CC5|nr:uncharacterized protein LOC120551550 [Perca fluviatilis]